MTVGTKVTTDPASTNNPIQESTGIVTSDSLAAESAQQGGSFAEGQSANISGQSSQGTTANNTDTSGATTLPPTTSRSSAGFSDEDFSETLKNTGGDSTAAGFSAPAFEDSLRTTAGGDKSAAGSSGGAGFSDASFAETLKGQLKPKGEGLKEGGFGSDAPNASFNNEIGTKNDPGRVAEEKFARENALAGADAGGAKDSSLSGEGQFDALKSSEPA